jgi:hypothetical protein
MRAQVPSRCQRRNRSYREAIPAEGERLRAEGRRYSRWHNGFQWLLIFCSAAIPAVTALYDPPQPGRGLLIGLGAAVSVITSAMGYYKFRERSFNLQQTADSIEQHLAALDLAIPPYSDLLEVNARSSLGLLSLRLDRRAARHGLSGHLWQSDVAVEPGAGIDGLLRALSEDGLLYTEGPRPGVLPLVGGSLRTSSGRLFCAAFCAPGTGGGRIRSRPRRGIRSPPRDPARPRVPRGPDRRSCGRSGLHLPAHRGTRAMGGACGVGGQARGRREAPVPDPAGALGDRRRAAARGRPRAGGVAHARTPLALGGARMAAVWHVR